MMSVGERRGLVPVGRAAATDRPKPSRLEALQADFQNKILREKQQKLYSNSNKAMERRHRTLSKHKDDDSLRNDSFSAPGRVRTFFNERRTKMPQPNSASPLSHLARKREGYDKSHPLQPINHHAQNLSRLPQRGMSDPTLMSSSKEAEQNMTEFKKWRMEQDVLDRQRRLNAMNKRNGGDHTEFKARVNDYESEMAERQRLKEEEELEKRALASQRKEDERSRRSLVKQKLEDKRRQEAAKGQRRKEESERLQGELAKDLELQKEAEEEQQVEMLRQLELQLEEKKRDLADIQKRKPRELNSPDQYRQPSRTERQTPSRTEHQPPSRADRQAPSRTEHPSGAERTQRHNKTHEDAKRAFPTKPRKVNRKEANVKVNNDQVSDYTEASSLPTKTKHLPAKSQPKTNTHDLNTTYKISREDSMPITVNPEEHLEPFVIDGEGLAMDLSPCAVCGRKFATDRLAKHQKACKTASKPRKQFNTTSQRIAGSGAEKYQHRKKQNESAQKPAKKNWRAQHEEFVASIRYAKMAATVEARGGNVAELTPPPKAENPDYVQCPHCSRRFNQAAAERHIPKCKDTRAKPTVLKKGGRR